MSVSSLFPSYAYDVTFDQGECGPERETGELVSVNV